MSMMRTLPLLISVYLLVGLVGSADSGSSPNSSTQPVSIAEIDSIISDIEQMDLRVVRLHDAAYVYREYAIEAQRRKNDAAYDDHLSLPYCSLHLMQKDLIDLVGRADRINRTIKQHAKAYLDALDEHEDFYKENPVQCYNYHSQVAFALSESLEEAEEYLYSVINRKSTKEWKRYGIKAKCYADLCILYARVDRVDEAVELLFRGIMANLEGGAVSANYRLFWATKRLEMSGLSRQQLRERLEDFKTNVPTKQREAYDHACWLVVYRINSLLGTEEGEVFAIESEKEDIFLGDVDIPKSTDIWIGLLHKEVIEFRKRTIPDKGLKARIKRSWESLKEGFRRDRNQ